MSREILDSTNHRMWKYEMTNTLDIVVMLDVHGKVDVLSIFHNLTLYRKSSICLGNVLPYNKTRYIPTKFLMPII